jgi:hypothetical protein
VTLEESTVTPSSPFEFKLFKIKFEAYAASLIPTADTCVPMTIDPVVIEVILKIVLHVGSPTLKLSGSRAHNDTVSLLTLLRALASWFWSESEELKILEFTGVAGPRTARTLTIVLEKQPLPEIL